MLLQHDDAAQLFFRLLQQTDKAKIFVFTTSRNNENFTCCYNMLK
jgi:hypothetical protein